LIVGALRRNAGTYIGDYQLEVSPYFFMSEKGTLSMIVSNESLRKLTQGIPVSVTDVVGEFGCIGVVLFNT
jgi:hypothetical protein